MFVFDLVDDLVDEAGLVGVSLIMKIRNIKRWFTFINFIEGFGFVLD